MNSWSSRRKLVITSLILLVVAVVVGIPAFFYFHKAPTCFDGKMNGDETGVDCGGLCTKMCISETLPLLMTGDPRVVPVTLTTYAVALEVQNPNIYGEVAHAGYTVKIYGSSPTPLKVLNDEVFIPHGSTIGIFLGPLAFDPVDLPTRATFEWHDPLDWERNTTQLPSIKVTNPLLDDSTSHPKLTANVENDSLVDVQHIEVVAFVEDSDGNIVGASKTLVDDVPAGQTVPIIFTWPNPFVGTATAVEVIPRVITSPSYR